MDELISIIIPTYNAGEFIGRALESVYNQTYKNIEVIVIDDGSEDDTDLILEDYMLNDNFTYIKKWHSGLAAVARNEGLEAAVGSYVAFLDADDYWAPDKLKKQIELFKNEEIGLVYSNGHIMDTKKLYSKLAKPHKGNVFDKLISKNFIATSSVIIRREVLDEIGVFSEDPNFRVGEDYDLWLRIAQKYKVGYAPEDLFAYRLNQNGLTKNKRLAYKNLTNLYKAWLKEKLNPKQKFLFKLALVKNYLKIIVSSF